MTASTKTKTNGNGNGAGVAPPTPTLQIDPIRMGRMRVPIIGTTPLIVHRFSEKAKRILLESQQGRKAPKEPKDPQAEYEACFYRMEDDSYGLPADAFKQATVGAARFYGKAQLTMTALKLFIFVHGEPGGNERRAMVRIDGEPQMREDVARVGKGTEMRYRPEFWPWTASLDVTFPLSTLTDSTVLSLIDAGGMAVGVGEWRPERGGTFGTYRVDPDKAVEIVTGV